jgi:hypothetical protein
MPHAWLLATLLALLAAGSASPDTIDGRVVEDHTGSPLASADVSLISCKMSLEGEAVSHTR